MADDVGWFKRASFVSFVFLLHPLLSEQTTRPTKLVALAVVMAIAALGLAGVGECVCWRVMMSIIILLSFVVFSLFRRGNCSTTILQTALLRETIAVITALKKPYKISS